MPIIFQFFVLEFDFNYYFQDIQIMGAFRSTPDNQKHVKSTKVQGLFSYTSAHMCGWRIYMEDAHIAQSPLTNKQHSLFAVFDGHGGPQVSAYVQKYFVKELQANKSYLLGDYQKALKQTFFKMDDLLSSQQGKKQIVKIQKEMREKDNGPKYEEQSHAGCTANVILITPEWIFCANAGDSRSVARINGQTTELSRDHKPQDPIELERIKKAGGTVSYGRVNGGLNLSRAIGDFQYKKNSDKKQEQMITSNPDITKVKNQNIDFIIMGCDGIWQVKTNGQMIEWIQTRISKGNSNEQILRQLLDELVSKDNSNQFGMDNMSAILIRFEKKK